MSTGLSTGAKAGIDVGAAVLFLATVFINVVVIFERRSKKSAQAETVQDNRAVLAEDWKEDVPTASDQQVRPVHELLVPRLVYETTHGEPMELDSSRQSIQ